MNKLTKYSSKAWQKALRPFLVYLALLFAWLTVGTTPGVRRRSIRLFLAFLVLIVIWATIGIGSRVYEFWDDDEFRGATTVETDRFGDHFSDTVYLKQGWDESDSLWFYTTTQGSNLLPYDFFLVLEQAISQDLFRDNENINRYRYLPQKETSSNPDALPVGMTRDEYKGKEYMGFTCAACHTTQLNYGDVGIRIDGGPTMADMESFMKDLAAAMNALLKDGDRRKRTRFVRNVLKLGNYDDEKEVLADLKKYARRITTYNVVNNPRGAQRPLTTYGYARLDAFGRIYNRVLEHVMSADQLRVLLSKILTSDELNVVMQDADWMLSGDERAHIIERLLVILSERTQQDLPREIVKLRNWIYNPADAPVSYPFLWDIPQHDYVQWNGVVGNSGVGPMGRNAGQVIGVFGTLDWQEKEGFTLASVLGGQGFGDTHIDFQSSIDIRNLRRVEGLLRRLRSPRWPEDLLKTINRDRAARGENLFDRYCESCHQRIDRDSGSRRVVAKMIKLSAIGTDPKMAENSVQYIGYSGILMNQYVTIDVGKILLERRAPVAALLTSATRNVVSTPDPDKLWIRRWAERIFDFIVTIFDNEVRASIKRGDYDPDTTATPFASLRAYKSRSLNGIWATAPYLHNGSVPTLYHLLLPKKREGDSEDGEYRPDEFRVGSREFDPDNVGFRWEGYDGFLFRTNIYGNSNAGHEYAAGRTTQPDGRILPALDKEQRLDLLEYLKIL